MRRPFAASLLALVCLSCASTPLPRCVDLSGTYALVGTTRHTGAGSANFHFGESSALREIHQLTIAQSNCVLRLHIESPERIARDVTLEEGLEWTEDGASFTWKTTPGSRILPAVTSQTRTLRLRLTSPTALVLSSELEERGLALMFLPYKDHGEAVAVFERIAP